MHDAHLPRSKLMCRSHLTSTPSLSEKWGQIMQMTQENHTQPEYAQPRTMMATDLNRAMNFPITKSVFQIFGMEIAFPHTFICITYQKHTMNTHPLVISLIFYSSADIQIFRFYNKITTFRSNGGVKRSEMVLYMEMRRIRRKNKVCPDSELTALLCGIGGTLGMAKACLWR